MDGLEFDQLVKTFRTVEALPQLPESSFRLVQTCEDPDANLHDAEMVIASDPGLLTVVLRAASAARFASMGGPATTVNAAVMRLGMSSLKALAMTHAVRSLIDQRHECDWYDSRRFAAHSVFVAVAMQHLFEREFGGTKADLEEIFTFGLLHDLGICLLAHIAPDLYDHLWRKAESKNAPFEDVFFERFHEHISTLAWAAATAWRLPDIFVEFLHQESISHEPSDLAMVIETLEMAESLTISLGMGIEPWITTEASVELEAEEIESIKGAFSQNWQGKVPFPGIAA